MSLPGGPSDKGEDDSVFDEPKSTGGFRRFAVGIIFALLAIALVSGGMAWRWRVKVHDGALIFAPKIALSVDTQTIVVPVNPKDLAVPTLLADLNSTVIRERFFRALSLAAPELAGPITAVPTFRHDTSATVSGSLLVGWEAPIPVVRCRRFDLKDGFSGKDFDAFDERLPYPDLVKKLNDVDIIQVDRLRELVEQRVTELVEGATPNQ